MRNNHYLIDDIVFLVQSKPILHEVASGSPGNRAGRLSGPTRRPKHPGRHGNRGRPRKPNNTDRCRATTQWSNDGGDGSHLRSGLIPGRLQGPGPLVLGEN